MSASTKKCMIFGTDELRKATNEMVLTF